MDSPPPVPTGSAYGSIQDGITLPRSELDNLTPLEVSHVQTEMSTELFGFSPMTFTSRVVDLANEVIYNVIDKIEVEVTKKWATAGADGQQDEKKVEAVQKGVNRLETLLMAAVDIRFDQAEVWLLRNTFRVPQELIPYIILPHHPQEGFAAYTTPGEDTAAMKRLEKEIGEINAQREEIALITSVEERIARRVEALKKVKSGLSELLSAGGTRDTLSSTSKVLASSMPSYIAEVKSLLNTT